jgi:hypothetical protein
MRPDNIRQGDLIRKECSTKRDSDDGRNEGIAAGAGCANVSEQAHVGPIADMARFETRRSTRSRCWHRWMNIARIQVFLARWLHSQGAYRVLSSLQDAARGLCIDRACQLERPDQGRKNRACHIFPRFDICRKCFGEQELQGARLFGIHAARAPAAACPASRP